VRQNRRLTESGRVEAFSDAVFAITITLLVLEIHRPALNEPELGRRLLERWPDYVAFAVSFVYVGVVWLNHHALFARIRNVDLGLNWINLLILATTALLPFPTGVVAGAFSEGAPGSREAAVVLYAIVGALMSAAWLPVFPYLARHPDLLLDPQDAPLLARQKSRPLVGVGSYLPAAVLGYYVSPLLALVLFVWMIGYHAITSEGLHANRLAQVFSALVSWSLGDDRRASSRAAGVYGFAGGPASSSRGGSGGPRCLGCPPHRRRQVGDL
jgi:uncharacterized membrane protein